MKKILAFSGSNSSTSINQTLINIVSGYVSDQVEVEVISLRDYPAPIYCIDDEKSTGIPPEMQRLFDDFTAADGFLISSPEHNGMVPTVFKNALDWISRMDRPIFDNKPVVFLSTSPGARGGASALGQLVTGMPYRGAKVIGGHAVGSFNDKVKEGVLVDEDDKHAIETLITDLEKAILSKP